MHKAPNVCKKPRIQMLTFVNAIITVPLYGFYTYRPSHLQNNLVPKTNLKKCRFPNLQKIKQRKLNNRGANRVYILGIFS